MRLEFTERRCARARASRLASARRDPDGLVLHVPTDGGVAALRAVLDQLDGAAADVTDVSLETPDLDDVFLSLTGQGDARKAATE